MPLYGKRKKTRAITLDALIKITNNISNCHMIYSFIAGSAIFRHHTLCTSGSASTAYILWGWYKLHPLVMFAVSTRARGTSRQVHKWMIRLRHALVHSGSAWESIEPRGGVQVLNVTELSGSWTLKSTRGGVQDLNVTELSVSAWRERPGSECNWTCGRPAYCYAGLKSTCMGGVQVLMGWLNFMSRHGVSVQVLNVTELAAGQVLYVAGLWFGALRPRIIHQLISYLTTNAKN